MRKAKFIKQHLIFITPEMDQRLHEITNREEISMAEFVRDAVERKFAIIDEQSWEHRILTDQVPEEEFEVHPEDMTLEEEKMAEEEQQEED